MKTIKIAVRKTKSKFNNAVRKTKTSGTMYIWAETNQPCGRVGSVLACHAGDRGSIPCRGTLSPSLRWIGGMLKIFCTILKAPLYIEQKFLGPIWIVWLQVARKTMSQKMSKFDDFGNFPWTQRHKIVILGQISVRFQWKFQLKVFFPKIDKKKFPRISDFRN